MDGSNTHPLISQLRPIFADLATCDADTLPSVLLKLDYIIEDEKDALLHRNALNAPSSSAALLLPAWINEQLRILFSKPATQLAGVRVVRALLRVEYMPLAEMTSLLSQLLLGCIFMTTDLAVGMEAAQVWGSLLNNGSSVVDGIVAFWVSHSIPLLRKNDTTSLKESGHGDVPGVTRLSGCVLLLQLSINAPLAVVAHLQQILEALLAVMSDSSRRVRDVSAEALFHTMRIAYRTSDEAFCHRWQDDFLDHVFRLLHSSDPNAVHGSIKFFSAMISTVAAPADFHVVPFSAHSREVIHNVWAFFTRDLASVSAWPDGEIREEMAVALPLLTLYDSATYGRASLAKVRQICAATFLADDGPDDRKVVFGMVSKLLRALPDLMDDVLDELMGFIERSLTDRPNRPRCLAAVSCFAACAELRPDAVRPFLRHLLGPIFTGSVTEDFATDIGRICTAFPELRSTCLSKMLEAIRQQLTKPRRANAREADSARLVISNLKALGNLDFSGYSTLYFLRDTVLRFVSVPNEEVRRRAVDVCFKLVHSGCTDSPCEATADGLVHHGREHRRLIQTVVQKLAGVAVADTESDIRLHTLEQFTEDFDLMLAQEGIITVLHPALYDKHQNRLAAVRLLARIARRNPACVYPMLRHVVLQCVVDTKLLSVSKKREQSMLVLSAIMEIAPDVMKPYVSSLLNDCVQRLRSPGGDPASVQTALLSLLGKLARYAEDDDIKLVAEAQEMVIEHIMDSSVIEKKQEAVRALTDIIRTTKQVDVYESHPDILRVLLASLHGGFKESWPVRQDVLKLLGVIGAVDPLRVKQLTRQQTESHKTDVRVAAPTPAALLKRRGDGGAEEMTTVATVVLQVLQQPSLSEEQYVCAVKVIAEILGLKDSGGNCLLPYYPNIVSTVLHHTSVQKKSQGRLLSLLRRIAYRLGPYVRPHVPDILAVMTSTILPNAERDVLVETLCLFGELRRSLREEFAPYLATVLSPVVTLLLRDPVRCAEPIFAFFIEMGALLDEYLPNLLPYVCDIATTSSYPLECRVSAVDCVGHFAKRLPRLPLHASRALHSICSVLKELEHASGAAEAEEQLVALSLATLRDIARNLGREFEKYVPMVLPVLAAYGDDGSEVRHFIMTAIDSPGHVVAPLLSREQEDAQAEERYGAMLPNRDRHGGISEERFAKFCNMMRARESESEERWNMWVKKLATELLRLSPARSHQCAHQLAVLYEPFARQMLHSAFAVCFDQMTGQQQQVTTELLSGVLRDEKVPSEVLQELLNLAEFIERIETRFDARNPHRANYASGLLFSLQTLMETSERCTLYSKALHYVEIQFHDATYAFTKDLELGRSKPLPREEWLNLLQLCEKCIYLCNLMGYRESAEGILKYLQSNFTFLTGRPASELPLMMEAQLFEKLQWWSQSLVAYQQRLQTDPQSVGNLVGLIRSLDNLGDYRQLLDSWHALSPRASRKEASELAAFGAHAAWLLRKWDDMATITNAMPEDGYDGTTALFYRAVLAVHARRFPDAERNIQQCRKRLDSTLSALVAESYDRAYKLLVGIQQLSELEEYIFVMRNHHDLDHWQDLWERRLATMAYEGWPGTLANHTLIISPRNELDMWLRFVQLAHSSGHEGTAEGVLFELLGSQDIVSALQCAVLPSPATVLTSLQLRHDTEGQEDSIFLLHTYVERMTRAGTEQLSAFDRQYLAQCHSKLASWVMSEFRHLFGSGTTGVTLVITGGGGDAAGATASTTVPTAAVNDSAAGNTALHHHHHHHSSPHLSNGSGRRRASSAPGDEAQAALGEEVVMDLEGYVFRHLERATSLDSNNGVIWHTWASFNHDLVKEHEEAREQAKQKKNNTNGANTNNSSKDKLAECATEEDEAENALNNYAIRAIGGYLRSVCLSEELEDLLGFLSLWFSYGPHAVVRSNAAIQSDLAQVSPTVWLKVIPQVMARLHDRDSAVTELAHQLLVTIARVHPQALVYTLNVVSSEGGSAEQSSRQRAAQRILARIVELHDKGRELVEDAALVCTELVRCAVLWPELWLDELERSWGRFSVDQNPHTLLAALAPLRARMLTPETMAESHFVAEFADQLRGACDSVERACSTGNGVYMNEALERFRTICDGMQRQINNMSSLALQLVSPRLVERGRNLSLVVPGQYHEYHSFPCIASFQSTLKVMNSKQHPRRLYMAGTDGQTYKFLLKGHEDLRLDERVMQLLAFVNTLLEKHSRTQRRDCMIQVYSVTPLSDNAGLVGWVDHCDTLHQLIREYRVTSHNFRMEADSMNQYGIDLDTLMVIQRVEPFECALECTDGTDLAHSMWVRAPSAESWLDRRSTYVSSLATMSVVGHVLGLGDRHPSNLMIHAFSGRVVHIDFGDCFEVAQMRSVAPEKVPFRLTRMLVKAMEISGIEGIFRHDCTTVMDVLRQEGSSIIALLEAFVHDPLVSWWRDGDGAVGAGGDDGDGNSNGKAGESAAGASPADGGANAAETRDKKQQGSCNGQDGPRRPANEKGNQQQPQQQPRAKTLAPSTLSSSAMAADAFRRPRSAVGSLDRSVGQRTAAAVAPAEQGGDQPPISKAQRVVNRIREKLRGCEFNNSDKGSPNSMIAGPVISPEGLTVPQQVSRLIREATSHENLCVHYSGWCSYW